MPLIYLSFYIYYIHIIESLLTFSTNLDLFIEAKQPRQGIAH